MNGQLMQKLSEQCKPFSFYFRKSSKFPNETFLLALILTIALISCRIECANIGYPNCDNALLHGTAPVAPYYQAGHAGHAGHGAHSYAFHSAPAYNHYDDGQYHPQYNGDYHDYSTNDISGPGGDKYDQTNNIPTE